MLDKAIKPNNKNIKHQVVDQVYNKFWNYNMKLTSIGLGNPFDSPVFHIGIQIMLELRLKNAR